MFIKFNNYHYNLELAYRFKINEERNYFKLFIDFNSNETLSINSGKDLELAEKVREYLLSQKHL